MYSENGRKETRVTFDILLRCFKKKPDSRTGEGGPAFIRYDLSHILYKYTIDHKSLCNSDTFLNKD